MRDVALTLENDRQFYDRYLEISQQAEPVPSKFRNLIRRANSRLGCVSALHDDEVERLRRYFHSQYALPDTNNFMFPPKSPSALIANELAALPDFDFSSDQPHPTPPENIMSTTTPTTPITIQNKTLVNGADIDTLASAEIYSLISNEEAKIESLGQIKTKPKALVTEIAKRQAGIQALVDYLDSRPA